jgi:hypothetical protein
MNRALWIVQGLLSALFLFGGAAKLTMPIDEIAAMMGLPAWFLVFISVAEIAGGLGLILPGLLKIRTELTALAASGLVIIMVGATALSAAGVGGGDPSGAVVPLVTGILAAFVAYGRTYLAPFRRRSIRTLPRRRVLQHVA